MDGNRDGSSSFSWFMAVVVLVWWIFAFWYLLRSNAGEPVLGQFLRPEYWWLVEVGAAILVLFLVAVFLCADFSTGRRGFGLIVQMGIMIVPILYLPTAIDSQLSPEAANKRSFFAAQSRSLASQKRRTVPTATAATAGVTRARSDGTKNSGGVDTSSSNRVTRSVGETGTTASSTGKGNGLNDPKGPSFLDLASDSEPYEGKRVSVEGIVYRDAKLPKHSFFCYRLVMFCCAADASPAGILVKYHESGTLKKGTWVKVKGVVGTGSVQKQPVTEIAAEKVESTKPPRQQYVVPSY